ncbi:hypothetical protein A9Q99_00340 [Gammaproteobacteria bacterium 45_16_T64]|nr:hypothetical protein A9Q99_00340 [Gammaproteobacteria bacterium 45_16_T64]
MREHKHRLLVVDDKKENIYALKRMLEPLHLDICEATSGQEALKHVIDGEFFLILMDVQMPGMNGFETASLILENQNTAHIPIIFVTAISKEDHFAALGYESGAVDYIYKPIDPLVLIGKIKVFRDLSDTKSELTSKIIELESNNQALDRLASELIDKTETLKRVNGELRGFSHTVSHDMKQPLSAIVGYANRLLRKHAHGLDKEGNEIVTRISSIGSRMSTLINALLDNAEKTSLELQLKSVNLDSIVENVILDLDDTLSTTGGKVESQSLPTIDADPNEIYQLFSNIVSNALKYHRPNVAPVVRISSKTITDRRRRGQENSLLCQIFIEDNGIGFEESEFERMLIPFQRLTTESSFEGTGVGTGTVKKIVDHHNGSISAKSEKQKGSTFIISLPINQC